MKSLIRFSFLVSLFALTSFAQSLPPLGSSPSPFGAPPPTVQHVHMTLAFDKATYAPGDTIHGVAHLQIDEKWHINSAHPITEFSIPTTLELTSAAMQVEKLDYPAHEVKALAFAGGDKLAVYEGKVDVVFTAKRTASSDLAVHAKLHYQACDDSVCLRPLDLLVDGKLGETVEATAAASTTTAGPARPASGSGVTLLTDAPKTKVNIFKSDVGSVFKSYGLAFTLGFLFLAGLVLNLTPCVYPLIPITVTFFANQADGKKSTKFLLSCLYVAGLASIYTTLGVVAAMTGKIFGSWLQQPGVLIFFAVLMLVFASSMFGLFEFRVPHFVSDRAGARGGPIGALTMGLLAGVVAAPCTGPVVAGLMSLVGNLKDPLLGGLMFFMLALGLGFPYLIGLTSLPRSGAWMVAVKKALGFVLIATSFYFLRALVGDNVYGWGAAISLAVGGLFLLFSQRAGGAAKKLTWALALLLFLGGFTVAPRKPNGEVQWDGYAPARVDVAKRTSKPVIIDFYADWCVACKELDHNTYTDAKVIEESKRFIRLKADLTGSSDDLLARKYGIVGLPVVLFIDSQGNEVAAARLTGFEKPEAFLQRMQQVK